jgi:hypothetical protein
MSWRVVVADVLAFRFREYRFDRPRKRAFTRP